LIFYRSAHSKRATQFKEKFALLLIQTRIETRYARGDTGRSKLMAAL